MVINIVTSSKIYIAAINCKSSVLQWTDPVKHQSYHRCTRTSLYHSVLKDCENLCVVKNSSCPFFPKCSAWKALTQGLPCGGAYSDHSILCIVSINCRCSVLHYRSPVQNWYSHSCTRKILQQLIANNCKHCHFKAFCYKKSGWVVLPRNSPWMFRNDCSTIP